MTHDLREVLSDPVHFMARKGWNLGRLLVRNPGALRPTAKRYAKYDLVQVLNKALDKTGLDGSLAERFMNKFLTGPVERRLRMKRAMSLLISSEDGPATSDGAPPGGTANHAGRERRSAGVRERGTANGRPSVGNIVQGRFQSPILVQWRPPDDTDTRRIVATLSRFE
ncbi:MAG: hypothetical protein BRD44_01790 [Bacteroidetes bacterium QS_7_67_15]|nr:MAG: hypothetical protein BRD44_01790 [Bacteroidetes bacterium QS_7_67_15]